MEKHFSGSYEADVISDGGSAGVQNDDSRLSPPSGHRTRRPASAARKFQSSFKKKKKGKNRILVRENKINILKRKHLSS